MPGILGGVRDALGQLARLEEHNMCGSAVARDRADQVRGSEHATCATAHDRHDWFAHVYLNAMARCGHE
jgi:hypothetical protein